MIEDRQASDTKAPFNMAINTLERLGYILSQIRAVGIDPLLSPSAKQAQKVYLVRQFFVQGSPLLSEDVVEELEDSFLELKPMMSKMTKNGRITGEERNHFSYELDNKLDMLLLKVQRELQKERYFMPPKKDKGRAVAEF